MGKRSIDPETGLNEADLVFCITLREDPERIGYKAYMAAHPKCKSINGARVGASKKLTKPNIKAYLLKRDEKDMAKHDLTVERVNKEKACLAYFNPKSLFDANGNMIPIQDWPDEVATAIESIQVEARREGQGDDAETYYLHKITWAKKSPILDQISKQLGQYEKDNAQKGTTMADLINGADGKTRGLPPPEPEED